MRELIFDNVESHPSWFMLLPGDMKDIDAAVSKALDAAAEVMSGRICSEEGIGPRSRERGHLTALLRKQAEDYLRASLSGAITKTSESNLEAA